MEQATHTPGPWYEASTGNHQGLIISEVDGANIAVAYDKTDAALIATAPKLLAACQAVASAHSSMETCDMPAWLDDVEAAIAEATGQTA